MDLKTQYIFLQFGPYASYSLHVLINRYHKAPFYATDRAV